MDDGSNVWRWCTAAPTSLAFAAVVHSCSDGPDPEVATAGETASGQKRTTVSNCVWTEAHIYSKLRLDRSAREFSDQTVKQKVILVILRLCARWLKRTGVSSERRRGRR